LREGLCVVEPRKGLADTCTSKLLYTHFKLLETNMIIMSAFHFISYFVITKNINFIIIFRNGESFLLL